MARGRRSGKQSGSKPTKWIRSNRQEIKERYVKAREDAQLVGLIPTKPEEAVKDERVNSVGQFDPALPQLVREALKDGWTVPDAAKPHIVAALLEPFFKDDIVFDEEGKPHLVKPPKKLLNELAKTLKMLDQTQFERDHPEQAAKAKGGAHVNVNNVQQNIQARELIREMVESGELGCLEDMRSSVESSSFSSETLEQEVDTSETSSED